MSKIRNSGGYRQLASFQAATLIYDATYCFCESHLDSRSRTVDQMIQAARSGRQNIAEGSRAAATSSQTELRLVNVARSSLEELLLDYEDFLRHRRLPLWPNDSPEAMAVRCVPRRFRQSRSFEDRSDRPNLTDPTDQKTTDRSDGSNLTDPTDRKTTDRSDRSNLTDLTDAQRWALYSQWLDHSDPAVLANAVICLIHQANFLLDRQITALENQFIHEGGYSEQLAAARLAQRAKDRANASNTPDEIPTCPKCGGLMVLRTAKHGQHAGKQFWGCSGYPACTATSPV